MDERRFDARKQVNTAARLYHPELGRVDGIISDISDSGLAIKLNYYRDLNIDMTDSNLFLRPVNLDVLFSVSCIRQLKSEIALKFLE